MKLPYFQLVISERATVVASEIFPACYRDAKISRIYERDRKVGISPENSNIEF